MTDLFHTFVYLPLYNLLVYFISVVPGADIGLAVIGVTLAVKLILMPLSLSAVKTQEGMKKINPQLKALREQYKDNPEQQAKEMFALYKEHNIKPFASILLLILQIPILFGLYFVCQHAVAAINPAFLYSFVHAPETVSVVFLGLFAVGGSSIVLAVIAGLSQAAQGFYSIPLPPKPEKDAKQTFQEEFGRSMALQVRYVFPLLIAAFAFTSGAIALYFTASNLFMIAQEFYVRRRGIRTV